MTATKEALLDTYTPGQTITYVTRVENTGSAPLYNLTIVDNLADGLIRYINTSVEGYLNGSPIEIAVQTTTNSATFKVNSIVEPTANGGSTTGPVITVKPDPTATVTIANYAALEMTKSVDKSSIYSGESLVYTFKIINRGNETATNVAFSDIFPAGYKIETITLKTPDEPDPIIYDPTTYVNFTTLAIPNLVIPVGTSTLVVTGTYTTTT